MLDAKLTCSIKDSRPSCVRCTAASASGEGCEAAAPAAIRSKARTSAATSLLPILGTLPATRKPRGRSFAAGAGSRWFAALEMVLDLAHAAAAAAGEGAAACAASAAAASAVAAATVAASFRHRTSW